MGTASTKKFIKNNAGTLSEEAALLDSAGAGDADKIPALNSSGVLDPTIVNSTTSSGGVGDSGKVVALDGAGRINVNMMPSGIGPDVSSIVASENLSAGDFVNIWNDTGTAKIRKADASTAGKEAHGFVLSAVTSGNSGSVYFEGTNDQVAGTPTAGVVFLSAATPGRCTNTAPSGSGNVVQRVGFATSGTSVNFQSNDPIVLA